MRIDVLGDDVDLLGEGPVWDAASGRLLRVDITGRAVAIADPSGGASTRIALPGEPGCVVLRASGGLAVAMGGAIWSVDPEGAAPAMLADVTAGDQRVALNDGRCDAAGRLWVGSYALDEASPIAAVHIVDADLAVSRVIEGVVVGNGIDWSPDGSTAYVTDSAGTITAFDVVEGRPVAPRIFARDDGCSPDGLVVDAAGFVWSAKWDGWRLVRYAPDGRVDRVVELPVQRPTAMAFGGSGLATLFVTTATYGLDAAARAAQPLAGRVLVLDPGVCGLPAAPFAG